MAIGLNLRAELSLIGALALEKRIEQSETIGRDCRAVGMRGEQIVGVHGDEQAGVWVLLGDDAHGAVANGKIVLEIDFFKSGVFADKFGGKAEGLPWRVMEGWASRTSPAVVVAGDSLEHAGAWLGLCGTERCPRQRRNRRRAVRDRDA